MSRWVLLIRAANAGTRNRVPMADLRLLLRDLGHTEVRTVLNSGNAVLESDRDDAALMAAEVEEGMRARLAVDLRVLLLPRAEVRRLHADAPASEDYRLVAVLFAPPEPSALAEVLARDWGTDTVDAGPRADDGSWLGTPALHLTYSDGVRGSALQTGRLEKLLGVPMTARTPDTLAKLLD